MELNIEEKKRFTTRKILNSFFHRQQAKKEANIQTNKQRNQEIIQRDSR